MSFKKADLDRATGTYLQSTLNTTYARLVEVLGPPHSDGDGYKIDVEWVLELSNGAIVTIYNWKDGPNYCGEDGLAVENITDWHVGGHSSAVVAQLCQLNLLSSGEE